MRRGLSDGICDVMFPRDIAMPLPDRILPFGQLADQNVALALQHIKSGHRSTFLGHAYCHRPAEPQRSSGDDCDFSLEAVQLVS